MELRELIALFRKASDRNKWGEMSYIRLYDDGSGEVVSEDNEYDGDTVFEFSIYEELIKGLEKSLK